MTSLVQLINSTQVPQGNLAIFWLAQAGFVFKNVAGKVIYVDPYLTDFVEHSLPEYGQGFRRIMPSPIAPEEVEADYIISTHSHADHFDGEAIPIIARRNPRVRFIGAPDCRQLYLDAGVPETRFTILHCGETVDMGGVQLTGVFADHGELAPDALGLWLDFGGVTVWQVGDTAYRPDRWQDLFEKRVDVLLPPINGAFGNMNEEQAARLAVDSGAKLTIPCHFWMFPLHYGSPAAFLEACKQYAPNTQPLLMTAGSRHIYQK